MLSPSRTGVDIKWEPKASVKRMPPAGEKIADAGTPKDLIFAACAADFDQDGKDDIYAGFWNRHDVVLLQKEGGKLEAGDVLYKLG